tara:strand:+ start:1128 stop:1241 length:114 start_codon:yes stop_codon:yes gene_type:complete
MGLAVADTPPTVSALAIGIKPSDNNAVATVEIYLLCL